jgi:hypothetical protein
MKGARWMLVITLMMLPGLAVAQMPNSPLVVAQVPFAFVAGNQVIPAGRCIVRSATMDARTVLIDNLSAGQGLYTPAIPVDSATSADAYSLIFHKQGDQYFLRGIKVASTRTAYELPESKAEAEMTAKNGPATEETVVASLK